MILPESIKATKSQRIKNDPSKVAPIKIKLLSSRAVNTMFGLLGNLKGTPFSVIRATREIPPSLMVLNDELEAEGKKVRNEQGGQTKVILRGLTLVLRVKPRGATRWEDYRRPTPTN